MDAIPRSRTSSYPAERMVEACIRLKVALDGLLLPQRRIRRAKILDDLSTSSKTGGCHMSAEHQHCRSSLSQDSMSPEVMLQIYVISRTKGIREGRFRSLLVHWNVISEAKQHPDPPCQAIVFEQGCRMKAESESQKRERNRKAIPYMPSAILSAAMVGAFLQSASQSL